MTTSDIARPHRIRLLKVLRDVVAIFVLTFLWGFAVSVASNLAPQARLFLAARVIGTFAILVLGFAASGILSPEKRWRHLSLVAAGLWIVGVMHAVIAGGNTSRSAGLPFLIAIATGIGGGLSVLVKRKPNKAPHPTTL
jgi:FtsH-binding integral membrane protein